MNWTLQVAQVARKDLKQVRWMLILFVAGIAMSTWGIVSGTSFGPYETSETTVVIGMPNLYVAFLPTFVALMGIAIAALLVQLDSPSRPNAFWVTRPITPSAVLTSKLLLILVGLVGATIVGGGIAMWSMDASVTAMVRALLKGALSLLQWVLVVLVVAAITRDLREFVVGIVATLVLLLLVGMMTPSFAFALPKTLTIGMTLGTSLTALWFVVRLYRTRERTRSTLVLAFAIATALIFSSFTPDESIFGAPAVVATVPPVTPLRVTAIQFEKSAADNFALRVSLSAPAATDSVRFDFAPERATLKGPTGDVPLEWGYGPEVSPVVLSGAIPWVGRSVKWLGHDTLAMASSTSMWSRRKFNAADTLLYAGTVSKVGGTLTVSRARILASLPLKRGATAVVDGYRVNIYGGVQHDTTARVWIQVATINPPELVQHTIYSAFGQMALQFVLLNEERGEAMQITPLNSNGTGGYVVMPQLSITSTSAAFSTPTPYYGRSKIPVDEAWYTDARLVVMQWEPVGKFRLEAEGVVR